MNKYFFDSYALFEIVFGNEKYAQYGKEGGVTTLFNIAELNYGLKKIKSQQGADQITEKFRASTVKIKWEDILKAMDLKTEHKNLSIPDAIGYTVAKRINMKFLTGDEDFKDFDNVELVKK